MKFSNWAVAAFVIFYPMGRAHFSFDQIAEYAPGILKERVVVEGKVVSDPEFRRTHYGGTKTVFYLEAASLASHPIEARIRCRIYRRVGIRYGDHIRFLANLQRPYDFSTQFSYKEYLRRRNVYWIASARKKDPVVVTKKSRHPFAVLFDLRKQCAEMFEKYLAPGEAGIMEAMILGIWGDMPENTQTIFQRTGTSHILSISGLHIGIVTVLVWGFLKLFALGRKPSLILTIGFLLVYMIFTGAGPPVVRSTVMGVVVLSGFLLEREAMSFRSLLLAGGILFLINPLVVYDVGFQLSFASVGAIMLFYPIFWHHLKKRPWLVHPLLKYAAQSVLISIAAWAGVGALIVYYFGMVTPVSLMANLVAVPASTVIVGLGFLLLLTGWWAPAAGLTALTLKLVLNIMTVVIYGISLIPGAYVRVGDIPLLAVVVYYCVLFGGGIWWRAKNQA